MNKDESLYDVFLDQGGKFSDFQNDLEDLNHFLKTTNTYDDMEELIQILEIAANRHGPKHQLTIGHLLNILKLAEKTKEKNKHRQSLLEEEQHQKLLNQISYGGQD